MDQVDHRGVGVEVPTIPHDGQLHRVDGIDPHQAVRTRNRLLADLADTNALMLGTHFPQPTAGRVRSHHGRYRLLPEPGTDIPYTRPRP